MQLEFKGVKPNAMASIARVDEQHGDALALYNKMGKPHYPTQAQIQQLRKGSSLPSPEQTHLTNGKLTLELPANGLAVIRISWPHRSRKHASHRGERPSASPRFFALS